MSGFFCVSGFYEGIVDEKIRVRKIFGRADGGIAPRRIYHEPVVRSVVVGVQKNLVPGVSAFFAGRTCNAAYANGVYSLYSAHKHERLRFSVADGVHILSVKFVKENAFEIKTVIAHLIVKVQRGVGVSRFCVGAIVVVAYATDNPVVNGVNLFEVRHPVVYDFSERVFRIFVNALKICGVRSRKYGLISPCHGFI